MVITLDREVVIVLEAQPPVAARSMVDAFMANTHQPEQRRKGFTILSSQIGAVTRRPVALSPARQAVGVIFAWSAGNAVPYAAVTLASMA